jgi:hypothetical protein
MKNEGHKKRRVIDRNGGREYGRTRKDRRKRKMSNMNGGKKEGRKEGKRKEQKKITNE